MHYNRRIWSTFLKVDDYSTLYFGHQTLYALLEYAVTAYTVGTTCEEWHTECDQTLLLYGRFYSAKYLGVILS